MMEYGTEPEDDDDEDVEEKVELIPLTKVPENWKRVEVDIDQNYRKLQK